MVDLAQNVKSEHVRADCNKWVASVDGIAPLKKVQSCNQQEITLGRFDYGEAMGGYTDKTSKDEEVLDTAELAKSIVEK